MELTYLLEYKLLEAYSQGRFICKQVKRWNELLILWQLVTPCQTKSHLLLLQVQVHLTEVASSGPEFHRPRVPKVRPSQETELFLQCRFEREDYNIHKFVLYAYFIKSGPKRNRCWTLFRSAYYQNRHMVNH